MRVYEVRLEDSGRIEWVRTKAEANRFLQDEPGMILPKDIPVTKTSLLDLLRTYAS